MSDHETPCAAKSAVEPLVRCDCVHYDAHECSKERYNLRFDEVLLPGEECQCGCHEHNAWVAFDAVEGDGDS